MLVLSRRPDEKIVLPSVPAVIKVVAAQAGVVRLGLEAPAHVPILREELFVAGHFRLPEAPAEGDGLLEGLPLRHVLRNRLNNLILGLAVLRLHAADKSQEVRETFEGLQRELELLRRAVAAVGVEASNRGATCGNGAPMAAEPQT